MLNQTIVSQLSLLINTWGWIINLYISYRSLCLDLDGILFITFFLFVFVFILILRHEIVKAWLVKSISHSTSFIGL